MMSTPNMDVIKEIPGYKVIVKAILKNQIQQLVEQLASTTDEECVILTASLTDGSLSHLGSDFGKSFIEDHQDIKSQFLSFCLKKHHEDKQQEKRQQKANTLIIEDSQRSPRSGSSQTHSHRSKESISVRFEPYPMTRSRRSELTLDPAYKPGQSHVVKELEEHTIKVEPNDQNEVSNLSESDKASTPSDVTTEANMKVSVNDYLAQPTTQSLVDYDTDSAFDKTLPCLSVKLEAIAETLKTYAEHDSELEYEDEDAESMETGSETKSKIKGLGPMGAVHEKEAEATGIQCIETVHEKEPKATGIESIETIHEKEPEATGIESIETVHEKEPEARGIESIETVHKTEQGITRVEPLKEMLPIPNVPNVLNDTKFDPSDATVNQEVMRQSGTNRSYLTEGDNTEQSLQSRTTLQTHDTNLVIFNKCDKVFDDSNVSTVTSGNHTIVKPSQCEISCASSDDGVFNRPCTRQNEKNQHKCDQCGKCFPFKSRLSVHLAVHTGIKPFKCKICGKVFTGKQALTRHTVIHSGIKPFKCETCGKSFALKGNLTAHLASHSGVKPFKCDTCGKAFPKKRDLTSHLDSHSEVKPFKCDICGKSSTRKGDLIKHLAIHSGVKPFKCDICGKLFTRKGNLTSHLASHSGVKPFKCDTCGKAFPKKRYLTSHLVSHSEVKPFKCDICGKSSTRKGDLTKHLAMHSDVKPFKCDICGKSFTRKVHLTQHLARHLGIMPFK